ncbi:S-adenosyl-L-methionine-dependent methyltransferase [Rostrohypoxylon terebratum]|nr:S-adenosyl-L-methionine-dependent methyltransferase [Rostrohypoxylon terebratum]
MTTINNNSDVEHVARVLKQVAEYGDKFTNGDPAARLKLLASARELVLAAETPVESLQWNIWALPTRWVASRIALDLKIFETAVENGGCPKSDEDLAAATGASPILVKRISRICVSMGMLSEHGPGLYVPNSLTKLLAIKEYAAGIIFSFDVSQLSFTKMPEYLRGTNFQDPNNSLDGPFQYAYGDSSSTFSWLKDHPDLLEAFHDYIYTIRTHRPTWTDMYPVHSHLIKGLKPDGDASALIDIGGGPGQGLEKFRQAIPQYTGRLVLQERVEVVTVAKERGVDADGRIELQVHDFFSPQPIKGARAYFMRSIMHDWPDHKCQEILSQLKDAMEPGYSKILISDPVVSDQQPAWQHISLDLYMMAHLSSRERTEREWHVLMEGCGLEIVGIYSKGEGNESLIEVIRPVSD